jgi:hypothetical protein
VTETRKVRVKRTTETVEEIEVTFPIYRRHPVDIDAADIVYFSRVNADGSTMTIVRTWCNHVRDFELKIEPPSAFGDQSDYSLGRGDYASTAEEFATALAEFNADLNRMGFRIDALAGGRSP